QVLMNLAVNARDAMPTGGELRIETMLGRVDVQNTRTNTDAVAGVYACLEISDTGLGISPDVLPHIYEPFFTTKAPGKGTGLGLATVYGIMKQHHGWIEVATTEGSGTTFRAFFPLIDTSIEAPPLESLDPVLTVRGQGRTVLLVEDDGAIREMVQTILEHQGYTVIAATDAADALRRWRSNAELVLTDLVMPGSLDGRALAAELRCRRADLPVIFMTGYDAGLGGRPLDLGPRDGFLHKPFTRTQLFTLLAKLLTHRPSARASETSSDWMI
ncbi:MAG TPA: ATP-binding protein, partial [Opitutaceae bacterium]|nr:ATP-binding protein [Opitutaceae bacterium]